MAINLYGNVSGTYQKPNIDLFEMARKQNNQPVKFCDTEAGKNLPAIKLISQRKAYVLYMVVR